jgi:hypothetical protein
MSQSHPNTRSKSAAVAQKASQRSSPESEINTEQAKYNDARKFLNGNGYLDASTPCNPATLAKAIVTILKAFPQPGIPQKFEKALAHLAVVADKAGTQCQSCEKVAAIPDMIDELRVDIQTGLDAKLDRLNKTIEEKLTTTQREAPDNSNKLEEATKNLSELAAGLEAKINKVTDTTSQLANTATTYRDALINKTPRGQEQVGMRSTDPALNAVTSRKVRQVLVQLSENEAAAQSQQGLLDKAMAVISQIEFPPPPEGTRILEVTKLRKGAIVLLFNSKEAAEWIQHQDVELEFTVKFAPGCTIKPRQYAILAPRVPLTFEPNNANHLREIEERNGLGKNAITKAKWIKPANRRREDQSVAHATIILNAAKDANRCISEGLLICGAKVIPSKLKQEPTQCMKCRRWGHFASDCGESKDTCGTCGGEHRTNACTVRNRRYCVSCNATTHTSWDRDCPESERRRAWYDEKHPENMLKYFPTEDEWTREACPERIPIPDRFPARYAVGSLPPPNAAGRDRPTRLIEQGQGRPRTHAYRSNTQGRPTSSQRTPGAPEREEGEISQFHTPNQTPTRPESWEDDSSIDYIDPQN